MNNEKREVKSWKSGIPGRVETGGTPFPGNARFFSLPASLFPLVFLLAAAPVFSASPAPASRAAPADTAVRTRTIVMTPALQDYCRLLYGCGLPVPQGTCPSRTELGAGTIQYGAERCSEARAFTQRGIGPDHPQWGFRLYRFLGHEYRVAYQIADTLPVSRERLEYLLADIPLAAKLVSHYRKAEYRAEYVDGARTHFRGEKGKRLRGEAQLFTGAFSEGRLYYLGSGTAEVAVWTLRGPAMMDFAYSEVPGAANRTAYRMKILVFPGNGIINSIMSMGMFRRVVTGKIQEVLSDISHTAGMLARTGGSDLAAASWTEDERAKIQALLALP